MATNSNPTDKLDDSGNGSEDSKRRDWMRIVIFIAALLLIPLLPFLVFAKQMDATVQDWLGQFASNSTVYAIAGFALLASDIVLPVPSSLVCTTLGQILGWGPGATVSWAGLTTGNLIGLWLARVFGIYFAHRIGNKQSLSEFRSWAERYGAWLIVISRPIPLISEAVVLGLGLCGSIRWNWIGLIVICNFMMALGWTALGVAGQLASMEWLANVVSIAIPMVLLLVWRRIHTSHP